MKTKFMDLWDGFTTGQNAQVMVLVATNQNLMKQYFEEFLKHLKLIFRTKGKRPRY